MIGNRSNVDSRNIERGNSERFKRNKGTIHLL
jgi:hypothetical protein